MVPTCVNFLSSQAISLVHSASLPLLGGQNSGEGGIMRVGLKPVALTVILRLWWVLKITARQSNSMLEPTNACEPNVVRLERRCGSANR